MASGCKKAGAQQRRLGIINQALRCVIRSTNKLVTIDK